MNRTLELLFDSDDDGAWLLSPSVGTLTCAVERGRVLVPGQEAGVLHTLGVPHRLVVPAGATGRVVGDRPERVHAPVSFRQRLYALEPVGALDEDELAGALPGVGQVGGEGDFPLVPSPHAGRFWSRSAPGEEPFAAVGSELSAGTPLGLIEVMKTFTQIVYRPRGPLPERARVRRLLAEDGAEIEEGAPLFEVEPAG